MEFRHTPRDSSDDVSAPQALPAIPIGMVRPVHAIATRFSVRIIPERNGASRHLFRKLAHDRIHLGADIITIVLSVERQACRTPRSTGVSMVRR